MIQRASTLVDERHPGPDRFQQYFAGNWMPQAQRISLVGDLENRTNNVSEGFNSSFARQLPAHANLWLLLQKFQNLSEDFEINLAQDNFGGQRFSFQ